jgi:hypothetical protein
MEVQNVFLKCMRDEGNSKRLRVRIISPGYYNLANCQFPRDLREEGRIFSVRSSDVTLVSSKSKNYYMIRKHGIQIVSDVQESVHRVYQDEDSEECVVCMVNAKSKVFVPCGHFYTCSVCTPLLTKCPICCSAILASLDKQDMN